MKKLLCSLIVILGIFSVSFAKENFVSFSAGLSSGIPFYGTDSVPESMNTINTDHRVIIGALTSININVIKQITFFGGGDILADFNWKDTSYAHHLHVSFPLGIKVYPGIGGLNLGLSYNLGFRSDFSKTISGKQSNIAAWGNGFRLSVEYNFAHEGKSKYLPSIGCNWNFMPRGNNSYDNLIVFYITENF